MLNLKEAIARAYARTFTRDELSQVLAFGQTPVGAKWLNQSSDSLEDGDVEDLHRRLNEPGSRSVTHQLIEFDHKLEEYYATHPKLAKKLNNQNGN